ncbi:MAG TPA: RNA 2',3'-cyclic phosphodiesterase [Actinomycetes bacterium]|nr:RNA 2',3'-cyclic phosphodiesterase [Actinomycetes bacterium]
MRAFVAVMLPDAVRTSLESGVQTLRSVEPDLTWEAAERWHLTLTFLGDVDEGVGIDVAPRLTRAASRTVAFDLSIGGFGRFGRRVLYAKVGGDRAALRRLSDRTTAAARRAGIEVADERFRPHVTLARSRHGADLRALVASAPEISAEWTVTEITLVQSVLGADRRYTVVDTFPLAG